MLSNGDEERCFRTCGDGLGDVLIQACKLRLWVIVDVVVQKGKEDEEPEVCRLVIGDKEGKKSGRKS